MTHQKVSAVSAYFASCCFTQLATRAFLVCSLKAAIVTLAAT